MSLFAVDHQEIHCCYQFHVDFLCFFFVHMSSVIQTSQDICTHCRFCFGALFCPGIERFWQYYEYPVTVRQLLRTWINTSAWLPGDWQYNYNNTEHNKKVTIPRPRKIPLKRSSRQRTVSLIFFHSKVKSDGNTYLYVHMWANRRKNPEQYTWKHSGKDTTMVVIDTFLWQYRLLVCTCPQERLNSKG